jgi:predicted DNA-binding protein (MmcQ/YjbR family)
MWGTNLIAMNGEQIRDFVINWPGVSEHFPFDEHTLVFKVAGKMFLLVALDEKPLRANLKGLPEQNLLWREEFPEDILPGYHMSKTHWNTVLMEGNLSTKFLKEMIKKSYEIVIEGLPKKTQQTLK